MIFAQIKDGYIHNTIKLDDVSVLDLFQLDATGNPYDSIIQIDNIYPQPGINWLFDGNRFFPPLTLALIQNNVVVNIIYNSSAFLNNSSNNYQAIIDITNWDNPPQLGYIYNIDGSFSSPPIPGSDEYYQNLVSNAISFGQKLIIQAAARNISMGITQLGKTIPVMEYCLPLITSLSTGSLYAAITQIQTMIDDTSDTKISLSPFITNNTLYATMNQLQTYLKMPLTPNPG